MKEIGESLPKDSKNSLLRYLYCVERDQVSVKKVQELLADKEVYVNFAVQGNSALLIALNRFLDNKVLKILIETGADVS